VRDKCNDPAIDTRIIVGNNDAARDVARLAEAGFDDARFRVQSRVHNKGVIVDGEVVAVGSHNWSGDGTLRNRDATLLLHNRAIAAYFTAMFQDDWERRAKREIAQLATPLIATRDQPTPAGMVRVPWHAIYG
jgi:phosphatidylserine/phosphatidylglycerophosphate/cardiolipin synthase-like enzyme